jgi:manganese/zinc/iron transport system permease protein
LNPYWGNTFFEFFATLFQRILLFISGADLQLASDELQMCVLILVSISCATVGVFLVLRKMTMLANALSHTILVGIIGAFWIYHSFLPHESAVDFIEELPSDSLLIASGFVMALVTTFLTQASIRFFAIAEDAATAAIFTFLFAVGIVLVTCISRDSHLGIEFVMGNVDALHKNDLRLVFWVFLVTESLFFLCWRAFCVATFDPVFSRLCGISNPLMSYILMILVAICSIGAFRAVGVLMVLAFFVAPALIARLFVNELWKVLALSSCVAVASSLIGIALSRHLLSTLSVAVSTSGLIVSLLFVFYCACLMVKYVRFRHNVDFSKKGIIV